GLGARARCPTRGLRREPLFVRLFARHPFLLDQRLRGVAAALGVLRRMSLLLKRLVGTQLPLLKPVEPGSRDGQEKRRSEHPTSPGRYRRRRRRVTKFGLRRATAQASLIGRNRGPLVGYRA